MKSNLQFTLKFLVLLFSILTAINVAAQAPGNVSSNLQVWLKADTGVTGTNSVTNWADQSGNSYHVIQNGTNAVPSLNTGASTLFNYNPFLEFNTSDK